ncbi:MULTISPECIES: hypothetical protein [Bacillus subtilis group]|uniref:hypothetical protein n=1 Tax=Bacillus subtilis group TaxID=653685 RepID=UPI00119F6D80|nr:MULTISPECIES: hypothetical protein [Bacillus subtilis group]MEC2335219.1 hypothetical protein [Bacillus subtilis]
MSQQENLESYLKVITGKNFIKSAIYLDAQRMLFITYYSSYEEAKSYEEEISEENYNNYFSQGKIEKLIVVESARLLREYPFVESISIDLTVDGSKYDSLVTREKFNSMTGCEIENLSLSDGSWKEFERKYGANKQNRNKLFKAFLLEK